MKNSYGYAMSYIGYGMYTTHEKYCDIKQKAKKVVPASHAVKTVLLSAGCMVAGAVAATMITNRSIED